jgi:hypothetical protein
MRWGSSKGMMDGKTFELTETFHPGRDLGPAAQRNARYSGANIHADCGGGKKSLLRRRRSPDET